MRPSLAVTAFLALTVSALAGTEMKEEQAATMLATPFDQGKLELQSSSGAYFSVGGGNRPTLNYSSTAYRLGLMLHTPSGEGFFRGNAEVLLQLFYGSVFQDNPGNYLGGAMILLRYNFVQPGAKWVPYVQLGAGEVYNDIYKDHSQRLIGQQWEIDLEAAIGIHYFFNDRWSAAVEGGFRHNSNAGASDRNVGLNSVGATIGLVRHF